MKMKWFKFGTVFTTLYCFHNLQLGWISYSVCPWLAFPSHCYVTPAWCIRKFWSKWNCLDMVPGGDDFITYLNVVHLKYIRRLWQPGRVFSIHSVLIYPLPFQLWVLGGKSDICGWCCSQHNKWSTLSCTFLWRASGVMCDNRTWL
jgi:hypothetical protein